MESRIQKMSDATESTSLSVPKWDGNPNTCMRFIAQFNALTQFYEWWGVGYTANGKCPTNSEYEIIQQ